MSTDEPPQSRPDRPIAVDATPSRTHAGGLTVLRRREVATASFLVLLALAWGSQGVPALTWMNAADLASLDTVGDAVSFLSGLRSGIPPLLGGLEALYLALVGDLHVFAGMVYPVSIAAAFTLAVAMGRYRWEVAVGLVVVAAFVMRVGLVVHRGNPQVYDVVFPALVLGAFVLVRLYLEGQRRSTLLVGAGVLLSAAELTRPFMIYLLPFVVGAIVWLVARQSGQRLRPAIAIVLPVLLLSGGWHVHMLVDFGQVTWSNHTGFNLARGWEDSGLPIDYPPVVDAYEPPDHEIPAALQDGSFNSEAHHRVSEAMKATIVESALKHPATAFRHLTWRVARVLVAPTTLIYHAPRGLIFLLYRLIVATLLLATMTAGALLLARTSRGEAGPLQHLTMVLALLFAAMVVLSAAGERGEEARFVFSIAPIALAVVGIVTGERASRGAAGGISPS